jgi:AraC-like DNA-binding protein
MWNTPTALAMTLAPLKDVLPQYGIDFEALARRAGIDINLLTRPGQRLPSARIQKMWLLAAQESRDPLFGLRAGQLARPGIFHALGLGIVSSTSVLAALRRIERYSSVVSTNGRFVLLQDGPVASLETRRTESTIVPCPQYFDALVVTVCRILRLCAGPSAIPTLVALPYQSSIPAATYQQEIGCPVEFDADNCAIRFDAQLAARPVLTGNPELAAEADRMAARYIEGLAPESAATRVRSLLLKAMPSGDLDQDEIARALHQSASTLQRRLRREGTTYQRLLDATRRELAIEYLKEGEHTLADITFLLGFADQSNFTRAFRRWTGQTPREFLASSDDSASRLAS